MEKNKSNSNKSSEKEARKFIKILERADGGCSFCVAKLLELFKKEFPEHKSLVEKKLKVLKENEKS